MRVLCYLSSRPLCSLHRAVDCICLWENLSTFHWSYSEVMCAVVFLKRKQITDSHSTKCEQNSVLNVEIISLISNEPHEPIRRKKFHEFCPHSYWSIFRIWCSRATIICTLITISQACISELCECTILRSVLDQYSMNFRTHAIARLSHIFRLKERCLQ